MSTFTQTYVLDPGKNKVKLTILSLEASFQLPLLEGQADLIPQVQTFSWGESGTEAGVRYFTVNSAGEYVFAIMETEYPATEGSGTTTSYCHLYFKPQGKNWLWSTDAQVADNGTIFAAGQGEHSINSIAVQHPTEPNPPGVPGGLPSLDQSVVFLLDKNTTTNNLLFRGNEPLNAQISNQSVDFAELHEVLQAQYLLQTGESLPAIGSYILRDIAFLDPDPDNEGNILMAEISSFGATSTGQVDQTWFPAEIKPLAGGMLGQVANWNVEPTGGSPQHLNLNLDVLMVQNLSEWMNTQLNDANGNPVPTIYYIHCSSGHDRTGIVASGYLMQNYSLDLSTAFILGTTINKLAVNMGGNLVQNCLDVTSGQTDPLRSRCFVAGQSYNNTIQAIYKVLNNDSGTDPNDTFSSESISGDPAISQAGNAYVHSFYPWVKYTRNPVTSVTA